MDYKRVQIDSIGIGLNDITNLDLTKDNYLKTYLAVGDVPNLYHDVTTDNNNLNHIHNLFVTEKGVGINTHRSNVYLQPNNSLIVSGNIQCSGSIHAENIILDNELSLNTNLATFNQVLNRISSHLLFYHVKNYLENNIYTTHNVIIGNEDISNSNLNPLKISRHCNNNANNIQFIIQNNDLTNDLEPTNFSMGIIGNIDISPAHIITSPNMPLHFNVSKLKTEINNLYNDYREIPNYNSNTYPSLAIDVNGSVIINRDTIPSQITYNKYSNISTNFSTPITEYPKLFINGSMYADNILMYDYISQKPVNLDSIYIRQGKAGGLTLQANQILGGNFNKTEFIFNSNVYIGTNSSNYKLKIYGDAEITNNINTNNLTTGLLTVNSNLEIVGTDGYCDFNKPCNFYNESYFNYISCSERITTKILNITDNLLINGTNISLLGNTTIAGEIANSTVTNYLNIGGKTTGITDLNYNSEILNIYKFRDSQKQKFEILLNDTTITPYGSTAYIGHYPLNLLQNEIDNSLIILTQYNTSWNNIYFYAGKNKATLKSTIPNLAIMENNKIGINTITPEKTLDIIGDIIATKYYVRTVNNNYECKLPIIYNNYNNINNLNINITESDIITNPQKLNIKGGINSYDGYYESNNKICSIKYLNGSTTDAIIDNTNIGIGTITNNQNITMSLQIKNNSRNNNKINNSVISFYRSLDNSKYSGLEFCDDSTNLSMVNKNKWYIYKNHITDDFNFTGPLQIGYMKNSYKPSNSCINLYYDNSKYYVDINNPITYNSADDFTNNKETVRIYGNVRISGDLDLDGSINIKGNYKFNDNNILFSPNPVEKIITKIYSLGNNVYYFDTVLSSNHPKNISFKNSNLASFINNNIADDKLNLNVPLNITNSLSNYTISSNIYLLNSNLNLNIITYSNINNTIIYNDSLKTEITTNATNNHNNYLSYIQQNTDTSGIIITTTYLITSAQTNKNYAHSNYLISSNIYESIRNIKTKTITSFNSQTTTNSNLSLVNMNTITTSYNSINYNDDINIITKLGSNIFSNSLNTLSNANNYNNLITVSPFNQSYLTAASNTMISMSNVYTTILNYYNTISSSTIDITDYIDILNSNYSNSIYNSNNIYLNSNNLTTYNANYSNLTYNIITPIKNVSTINLNVSKSNLDLASKIYKTLSLSSGSYLSNAENANTIIINASNLNTDVTSTSIAYSNIVTGYLINSNIYSRYVYLRNDETYNDNNNTNYYIYHAGAGSTTNNIVKDNTQSNLNYSSNLYTISTDIYNTLNIVKTAITPYVTISERFSTTAYNNYITASNSNINFSNIYYDKLFISDIDNINNINYCNQIISSNIYINTSNYSNILNVISTNITTDIIKAHTDYDYSSQIYRTCSNLNIIKNTVTIDNLVFSNYINASNILIASSNIADKIVNNYDDLYAKITISKDIYNSTTTEKIVLASTKLNNSITTNLQTYLDKSVSNKTIASNLDYDISRYDPDYNEKLDYYQNLQEIGSGINKIKSFINTEKDVYINYKSNLETLFSNYIIEEYLTDAHQKLMNMAEYCVSLLIELNADATNLSDFSNQSSLLLELILHITNKYVNFINKSFDFANAASQVVATITDHIGIYILSSLSILPLLNSMTEYANTYLNRSWAIISRQIVLFASVSYSLNALIPTETPINTEEGQNTDVLIIGNNIKLLPTKSLLIGHANDYSRWIENLDEQITASSAYIYNYNPNSCSCSFNVKANKFISSTENSLALKTSSAIDINLVDTSIADYHNSMFDGVSLKLSHIYRRDNVDLVNANSNNSIFEIVRKQNLNNPYFSVYTNYINNIFNIGGGNFYDSNYNCIVQDAVVHINENTANYLLKLTNSSDNPASLILCNNTNKWTLSASNKLNFIYNTSSIININSNGISVNTNSNDSTVTINSFTNKSALELKNTYDISPTKIINSTLSQSLIVEYTPSGITYIKNPNTDTYDISKTTFEISCNVVLDPINYVLSNVVVSYNNINEANPFTFTKTDTSNIVNLLPKINLNDPKLSYTINDFNTHTHTQMFGSSLYTITYITPTNKSITDFFVASLPVLEVQPYDYLLDTKMKQLSLPAGDYVTISIDYVIGTNIKVRNNITYNKYKSFEIETLNLTLTRYNYKLCRHENIVPTSLYNGSPTNTIISTVTNNNSVTISNTLNYLKTFTPAIVKHQYHLSEDKLINYNVGIFELIYDIPINITITDYYDLYFANNDLTDQTRIPLEYININAKKPIIKHVNIYNNSHNIYSYTDDYELYLNENKLLNISSIGTLTTTGNIETNNLYLKGDIYNADGISLYDNILSLMNNISSTANLELHSKNIILNPGIGINDYYRGGVLINGNNINEINNNIFQINNYDGNDNLLTLNSSSSNSYAHFISKVTQIGAFNNINSIFRVGNSNGVFGIWKDLTTIPYNNNYFIDGKTLYQEALTISYIGTNFVIHTNGTFTESSDKRLKTDIKKIENALEKLMTLNGITYKLNNDENKKTGLIAQEVKEVLPEAISTDTNGYYSIAYGNLAGLIIEAIKELKTEIDLIKLRV